GAVVAVGFALAANAAPQTDTAAAPPTDTAAAPPAGAATDEQPPPQALPECPPGEQAVAPPPPAPAPPPAPVAEHRRRHNIVFAPEEVGISTGAGVSNYFGSAISGTTDPGAAWDARFTFGTRSAIALEAAYVGSSNNIDVPTGHGHLQSHGIDSDL